MKGMGENTVKSFGMERVFKLACYVENVRKRKKNCRDFVTYNAICYDVRPMVAIFNLEEKKN